MNARCISTKYFVKSNSPTNLTFRTHSVIYSEYTANAGTGSGTHIPPILPGTLLPSPLPPGAQGRTWSNSMSTSSRQTTKAAFSTASRLARFVPRLKKSRRVRYQWARSAAVRAPSSSSPLSGDVSSSSRIRWNCLPSAAEDVKHRNGGAVEQIVYHNPSIFYIIS